MASTSSLSYTGRDVVDIRRSLVSLVPTLTEKWRDFNESDLGMVILELIAGAQDLQNFYLDTQAFENFLDLAEQDKNIRSHLRAMNYSIPFLGSATGTVDLYFLNPIESPITIPKYTQLSCDDDLKYATTDALTFTATERVTDTESKYYNLYKASQSLTVQEGTVRSFTVTKESLSQNVISDGTVSHRIYFEGGDSKSYANHSVWIKHTNNIPNPEIVYLWTEVEDVIVKYRGGTLFSVHSDSYGEPYILMSVDFLNYIGDADILTIYWIQTLGNDGIAYPGTDSEINRFTAWSLDNNTVTVVQTEATAGSYSIPKLRLLKPYARRQAQTLGRYITIDDYKNGVATEPYIFRSVVKDWKSPHYVTLPYQVHIWAVPYTMQNLNSTNITTLKEKLYKKGVVDVRIIYETTQFIKIRIDIELILRTLTEANQEALRTKVLETLQEQYAYENLDYGYSLSLSFLHSQIRAMSSYIKDINLKFFIGATYPLDEYEDFESLSESYSITHNMTDSAKTEVVKNIASEIKSDFTELASDYTITTLTSISDLEFVVWSECSDLVLDEVEFPNFYQFNISSTLYDKGVEL